MGFTEELAAKHAATVDQDYDVTTVTLETVITDAVNEALEAAAREAELYPWKMSLIAARIRALKGNLEDIPCAGCGEPSGSFGQRRPNTIYRCSKCDD